MRATLPSAHARPTFAQRFINTDDEIFRMYGQLPDMLNGNPANFGFVFVSAGLAAEYQWVTDGFLAALPAPTTAANVKLRIACEATLMAMRLTANPVGSAVNRAIAVIVAAGRVAIRKCWGTADADLVASQTVSPAAAGNAPVALDNAGALTAPMVAPVPCSRNEWTTERDAIIALLDGDLKALAARCMQAAIGMPVCNGATIVRTLTHHYADPNKGICDAVVKQVFKGFAPYPAGLTEDQLKDAVCHKTAHPIDSPRLVWMARSADVKLRLEAAGLGSASVRIPAQFDPERAASSILALVSRAKSAAANANVAIDAGSAEKLVADVAATLEAEPDNSGMSKCKKLVEAYRTKHGFDISWCGGYMKAMFEDMNTPARSRSVIAAFGITKVEEDFPEGWAAGFSHYDLAKRWERQRAKEGFLAGVGLFGAKVPESRGSPEAGGGPGSSGSN